MKYKTALIVGATGLIGSELLTLLLKEDEYKKVIALVRRPLGITNSKLEERVIDFDNLNDSIIDFQVDDVFSCLGTTIKKAKSHEAMRKVDVTYPLTIARLTKKMKAEQFLFVSSSNASSQSRIFYSKIKGELEDEVCKIGFDSVSIFRPSLLLGDRHEFRLGEKTAGVIFSALSFLFVGPLRKFKGIQGKTVAIAMFKAAQIHQAGVMVYSSNKIEEMGNVHI